MASECSCKLIKSHRSQKMDKDNDKNTALTHDHITVKKAKIKTYTQGIMSPNDLDPVWEAFQRLYVWIEEGFRMGSSGFHRRPSAGSQSLRRCKYREQRGQEMMRDMADGRHPRSTCLSALWSHVWWCGHTAAPGERGWTRPAQSRAGCSSSKVTLWLVQRGPRTLQLVPPGKSHSRAH